MERRAAAGLAVAVGLASLAATGCWLVNLLDGAETRWAVATWGLLLPVAIAEATRRPRRAGLTIAALGVTTAVAAAWLGDRAGVTWWWLALAGGWWAVLAGSDWGVRPGLAVLDGLLAVTGAGAAILVALVLPEPVLSAAGLWAVLVIPWCGWRGLSWLAAARRARADQIPGRPVIARGS